MISKGTLYILRGAPGSGKSFACKELQKAHPNMVVCSADHYFLSPSGEYNFDKNLLGNAHLFCKHKFFKALLSRKECVLIDNCNVSFADIRDYITHAAVAGYTIKLVDSSAPWRLDAEECAKRNQHGVPLSTIQRMLDGFQPSEAIAKEAFDRYGIQIQYERNEVT